MAHQEKLYPDPSGSGHRLFVTDNFYTSHKSGQELKTQTGNKSMMLGTMKITNMNAIDRETVNLACDKLETMPHGSWVVCQVWDKDVPSTPRGNLYGRYYLSAR